jgi:hypothetical protein
MPALFFDSLLLVCRRGDETEMVLALASCQCRRSATFFSGPADGVSVGIVFAGGTIFSVSTRVLGSSSLSDFANSFSANAGSVLLGCCAGSTTKEASGAATLIAIPGASPIKQKRASHIVLDILESTAPREEEDGSYFQD